MEHVFSANTATELASDTQTRVSSHSDQAYQILRLGFIMAPIVAGLDKFFHLLVNWDQYLPASIIGLSLGALALARLSHEFARGATRKS